MSSTRQKYDECVQDYYFTKSIAPGLYTMNTPKLQVTCFQSNPQIINQKANISYNEDSNWKFNQGSIDVESDLFNLNRPLSKCPTGSYEPRCINCGIITSGQVCGDGVSQSCDDCLLKIKKGGMCNEINYRNIPNCNFPVENTRLDNPCMTLRGVGINRFDPLCHNPQNIPQTNVKFRKNIDMDSRRIFKDNFKPCLPKVKDATNELF